MPHRLPFRSIDDLTLSVFSTGSSFTCEPAVLDTDEDYLVLVENLDAAGARLQSNGWDNCIENWRDKHPDMDTGVTVTEDDYSAEDAYGARFQAWRDGRLNLIVTDDRTLYLRSVGATLVAKHLNLQQKVDRIALFRCIKYGEAYAGKLP